MAKSSAKSKSANKSEDVVSPEEIAEELNAPIVDQNEALLDYRRSGINRGYVDPGRDQEPDISPEFGSAPHPELFNPDASVLGSIGAQPSNDPRTVPEADRELPEDIEKNAETQSAGDGSDAVPGSGDESEKSDKS